jgi:magnesium-transporting ATPase (P-type)
MIPESSTEPTFEWHSLPTGEVFSQLEATPGGLSHEEARRRLDQHGPNRLPPPYRRSALQRLALQFHNVLIYVLIAAAAVTAALGHWVDTGVILGVVVINALIGFIQEGRAEQALDAIREMLSPQATVLRDDERHAVPAEDLVPGDVVLLSSGDKVPADLRLFRARGLRIDEALLTGESVPAKKHVEPVEPAAVVGDRGGMAFSGSLVSSGQGAGVVVATGEATQIGHISEMLAGVEQLTTPLLLQIGRFGRVLTVIILVLAAITFGVGTLAWGRDAGEMFLASVGLAVAAIPEGLPAILTITLAIGVQRMARRQAIIRRLPAVDTLGSVTTICSDKTGTLTRNEMTLTEVVTPAGRYTVTGAGYSPEGGFVEQSGETSFPLNPMDLGERAPGLHELLRAAVLCNDARLSQRDGNWQVQGDPTEGALLAAAGKAGLDPGELKRQLPRIDLLPFESEHKFMATLHRDHAGRGLIYLKGAPERVLERCSHAAIGDGLVGGHAKASATCGLADLDHEQWQCRLDELAGQGLRLLALARRTVSMEQEAISFEDVGTGMVLLGAVGIMDPPRDEAIEAIRRCQQAGIRVKMITGDHALTARIIGRRLGIGDGEHAVTGSDLDAMSADELRDAAQDVDVFARVSPEHKLRLVEAVQSHHEVVAMTGDGVNDAPALKRADVGVAMGIKGTEVSKEASDMVLTDDNFASIAHAVEEGRTVYDNIRKAILFLLPTNGGQSLVIIAAVLFGQELPITPVQILWVNMVVAVTLGLALAFEPSEQDVMHRPPRAPDAPLLTAYFLARIGLVSLLLWGLTFGLYLFVQQGGASSVELARTVAVNALVFGSIFYLFNARYILAASWTAQGIAGTRWIWIAVALVVSLQLLYTYLPLSQRLFETRGLGWQHWVLILPGGLAIFLLVECEKAMSRRWAAR